METTEKPPGPDLARDGAALSDFRDGLLEGHFEGAPVLLVRKEGGPIRAIGAKCTHYGGPLAQGLFDGELVRCPWHHACFRTESGEAVHAPAFDPVVGYSVEIRGDRAFVTGVLTVAAPSVARGAQPDSVVIVGGGAAGFAAAEMLRRQGYSKPITMLSSDDARPYDRPNASKDYLAGTAPEEWMPLRGEDWYREKKIEVRLGSSGRVRALAPSERRVELADGASLRYGALLLATGASPAPLGVPGSGLPHVRPLRTLSDSRDIIARAVSARTAVVVGASFIGLEVAASLTKRKVRVHVVAPDSVPMERVLGADVGLFVRGLHEANGVRFHLRHTVEEIREDAVVLNDGTRIEAELVVFGVGVRPEVSLAEKAGLRTDRGVLVDEQLRTSAEGIWAAGDIARWPDPYTGSPIRVEHWVVAERQGQTAARNILGAGERYAAVPFFWSQHYDVALNYVGHAEEWDAVEIAGDLERRDALVAYRKDSRTLAVVTVNRDVASLEAELAMERGDQEALDRLLQREKEKASPDSAR
ncbi:MAG TPA: FAD-dependent oxidoreductase [Thermoanaerobaculia bacterium]|jgi:NADPH-dependent 2,4-dienoyl-CoA reductase/sulfur reductase-like enzyme/nitrite reductase/ring-hydroxylating ferredoxin subunit